MRKRIDDQSEAPLKDFDWSYPAAKDYCGICQRQVADDAERKNGALALRQTLEGSHELVAGEAFERLFFDIAAWGLCYRVQIQRWLETTIGCPPRVDKATMSDQREPGT